MSSDSSLCQGSLDSDGSAQAAIVMGPEHSSSEDETYHALRNKYRAGSYEVMTEYVNVHQPIEAPQIFFSLQDRSQLPKQPQTSIQFVPPQSSEPPQTSKLIEPPPPKSCKIPEPPVPPEPESEPEPEPICETPQKPEYYTEQLRTQDLFWTTTIKQLSNHIKSLEDEKSATENSVQSMESSLLPFLTYQMIQLSNTSPNIDINKLITPLANFPSNALTSLPNLPTLDYFAIQDNDLLYMDLIKVHVEEANRLQANITNLRSQANELLKTKAKIDEMFNIKPSSAPDKLIVDAKRMNDMLLRLESSKSSLMRGIEDEKKRAGEIQAEITIAMAEIDVEKKRGERLIEALNHAGANIEIANAVNARGGLMDDEEEDLQDELVTLNEKYCDLQKEIETLRQQADEVKANYKKKMFVNVSNMPTAFSILDETTVNDANKSGYNCLCDK